MLTTVILIAVGVGGYWLGVQHKRSQDHSDGWNRDVAGPPVGPSPYAARFWIAVAVGGVLLAVLIGGPALFGPIGGPGLFGP